MWLEAIITQEDFVVILGALLPVKIYLHDEGAEPNPERWLLLKAATQVMLVPDEGLRITCPAEFSWSIAGMNPTMNIDPLRVMLRPQVVEKHKGHVLEFQIQVEEADFHSLPGFVDATIVGAVNASLATKKLPWNFTETLSRTVPLGKMFDPVEALTLTVSGGQHRITAEAMGLAVTFKMGFVRGD